MEPARRLTRAMDFNGILPALGSGGLIGLVLGLVGGGGSILAVPLLVYVVGVTSPHVAIGTSAVAVALNALAGLAGHARQGNVRWNCALSFAAAGAIGAVGGAELGKAFDGERLLALFGALMVVVGAAMLRGRRANANFAVRMTRENAAPMLARIVPIALATGLLAGFFGIGGGFLIVPGLILATAMPIGLAIGSSLVAVAAFGASTSASFALSGLVDWTLVGWLVLGGALGTVAGRRLGTMLGDMGRVLDIGFALLVVVLGGWIAAQGLGAFA